MAKDIFISELPDLHIRLRDDGTEEGGISHSNERLIDFIYEWSGFKDIDVDTLIKTKKVSELNALLSESGIMTLDHQYYLDLLSDENLFDFLLKNFYSYVGLNSEGKPLNYLFKNEKGEIIFDIRTEEDNLSAYDSLSDLTSEELHKQAIESFFESLLDYLISREQSVYAVMSLIKN